MNAYAFNQAEFGYASLDEAFPDLDPGIEPFGTFVLVQVRKPKQKTGGGIILPDEVRDTVGWNTQVAKVRAIGPICFKHPDTLEPWPEGAWVNVGDFVRVPKYGGDRWTVTDTDKAEVTFIMFSVKDLIGRVTDPLAMKAFI